MIDPKFVAFLRATLAKMAGTGVLHKDTINLEFWSSWPNRYYNVRTYDMYEALFGMVTPRPSLITISKKREGEKSEMENQLESQVNMYICIIL